MSLLRTILKVKKMRYSLISLVVLAAAASACDSPPRHAVAATASSKGAGVSVPNNGIIPGTPDGDLDRWVKDVRKGVAEVPALMKTDRLAAQRVAVNLYASRQEYSEMYYGEEGRLYQNDELAFAISDAEQRFHELLKLLMANDASVTTVKTAVKALDKQQAHVAKLWKKTDAHIQRPAK